MNIEKKLVEALTSIFGGPARALDIALILGFINQIFTAIRACQTPETAKSAIREGGAISYGEALAIVRKKYRGRERREKAMELVEFGKTLTDDELDALVNKSGEIPPRNNPIWPVALFFCLSLSAFAGEPMAIWPVEVQPTAYKFRAIMYSPTTNAIGSANHERLKGGDPRIVYQGRISDESTFPADVRRQSAKGWPVWHIETPHSPTGWVLSNGAKSFDQLDAIHENPDMGVPSVKETPTATQRTAPCTCNGGTNRAGCFCLKAGVTCKCTPGHESVWNLNDKGQAVSKTGQYVDRRQSPLPASAAGPIVKAASKPRLEWRCSGGVWMVSREMNGPRPMTEPQGNNIEGMAMEIINDMPETCAMECPDTRSWCQKRIDRLFPWKHCPHPDAPGDWKGCVTVRTVTKLSFADWLRVIVTGVVCVDVRTVTENEVGGTRTEVACFIGTNRDVRGER